MEQTVTSTGKFASGLKDIRNLLVGGVMALPLAGFVREAMQSEEITARFGLKLKALGEDAGSILPYIEGMSDKIHKAGLTQTEFTQALSQGSVYFKSMNQELGLLNTAIGMTKVSGVSLATAFQQLGYITMGYGTRIARYYGVSMHTEISNPTERAAKIIEELTKKMEPLAKQTGTTAEAFKEMGATIKDIGEAVGSKFLTPLGNIAREFNNLPPAIKEARIQMALFLSTAGGLAMIGAGLWGRMAGGVAALAAGIAGLNAAMAGGTIAFGGMTLTATGLTAALGLLGAELLIVLPLLGRAANEYTLMRAAQAEARRAEKSLETERELAMKARLGDLTKEMSMFEDLDTLSARLTETRTKLARQEVEMKKLGFTGASSEAQRLEAEKALKVIADLQEAKKHMTIKTEEELNKYVMDATVGQGSYQLMWLKKLEEANRSLYSRNATEALKVEKYITEEKKKLLKQLTEAYKTEIDKQLEYALMSAEDQKKYTEDLAAAKELLRGAEVKDIEKMTDAQKETLKTKGGQKALDEWTQTEAEREARRKQATYEHELAVSEAAKAKAAGAPVSGAGVGALTVNVTITPDIKNIAEFVGRTVEGKLVEHNRRQEDDLKKRSQY
jgi:hypothetical protein